MFTTALRLPRLEVATMVEKDEKSLKLLMQACTQTNFFFDWAFLAAKGHHRLYQGTGCSSSFGRKDDEVGSTFYMNSTKWWGSIIVILKNQVMHLQI